MGYSPTKVNLLRVPKIRELWRNAAVCLVGLMIELIWLKTFSQLMKSNKSNQSTTSKPRKR